MVKPSLEDFANWLMESEYGEYLATFNPIVDVAASPSGPRELRTKCLSARGKALTDFFLFGKSATIDGNEQIPPWVMELLLENHLLQVDKETGQGNLRNLGINRVYWMAILAERPNFTPSLYFGDDTVALLNRIRPRKNDRVLDLCTGPGTQAIWCSSRAREVIGVDINPFAIALAGLNARMNGAAGNTTFVQGDLCAPVSGEKFDFVCANTPLLPVPDELPYGLIGKGGPDGCQFIYRILDSLPDLLTDRGSFQTLGVTVTDGVMPVNTDYFERYSKQTGLGVIFTVLHHHRAAQGSELLDAFVASSKEYGILSRGGSDSSNSADVYARTLAEIGGSYFCDFYLRVSKNFTGFRLMDLSHDNEQGLWYL